MDQSQALAAMAAANMPREAFEELSDVEYSALVRMSQLQGVEVVARTMAALAAADRHATLSAFMAHELQTALERCQALEQSTEQQQQQYQLQLQEVVQQQQQRVAADKKRRTPLKVDVAKYRGNENESLLRWLVEMDAAIHARCIEDEGDKVVFTMSNLGGRAKTWAYGRRLADARCFSTYSVLKSELRDAFEPPKSEFRARAEFLNIKQGKRDLSAYCQYARYLVSCIVADPVDESTKVVAFMTGLVDGPVKTYLFREYPQTLEDAITYALQEDFSLQQAYVHSSTYRPPRGTQMGPEGSEPMDLSAVEVRLPRPGPRTCHRCGKTGHMAFECLAPRPVANARPGGRFNNDRNGARPERRPQGPNSRFPAAGSRPPRGERPKNGASR